MSDKSIFKYAVAISPPDAVIEEVRQLKQKLRAAIGWYRSVNAMAHITFNVFEADADTLMHWETYTAGFSARQQAMSLCFNHTNSFPNGAFFLAPDKTSEQELIHRMKDFHRAAPLHSSITIVPHMSIGRDLTAEKLSIARVLIREVDIRFIFSDLVIRRFNNLRKQYDIYKRFPFSGSL